MRQEFIAIMPEIIGERFAYIGTSVNRELRAGPGEVITSRAALDFLYSLHTLKEVYAKIDRRVIFLWYAATLDVEMIARDLNEADKDRMFPSEEVIEERRQNWLDQEVVEIEYARAESEEAIKLKGRELKVLKQRAKALEYIFPAGTPYRIQYHAGKTFTIGKVGPGGKVRNLVTIYDLLSFFRCPLEQVAREHLGVKIAPADQRFAGLALWEHAVTDALVAQNKAECQVIADVAERLRGYFADAGIYLQQWYGPSAAANYCLSKWNARDQFRPVTRATAPRLLTHAIDRAMYGGRIELVKVGTVLDRVYIYDINAAYANAIRLLGKAVSGWRFVKEFKADEPFSVWFVDYDLKPGAPYLGLLPHRASSGGVAWRQSGRGWFWWPEVTAALRSAGPDAVRVKHGYVMPFEPIDFGGYIETLYDKRRQLKAAGDPSETALKLLLASLYGKFAQQIGAPRFAFRPWAGWITSYVRAQLVDAMRGHESKVIGFAQDAIHATGPLDHLPLSDRMGDWKLSEFDRGFYIAPGVYELRKGSKVRRAMRGFERIDFDAAREQLSKSARFSGEREFFVGYRMAKAFPLEHGRSYLQRKTERFELKPTETQARTFPVAELSGNKYKAFNLAERFVDSRPVTYDDGRESCQRRDARWLLRTLDMMIDVIKARRYERARVAK